MPFATTQHLNLRAYRESDKESFLEMENDTRVSRTGNIDFIVPKGPDTWKKLEEMFSKQTMVIVVEVKKEYAPLRKWDEDETKKDGEAKKQEDWDRELFAGYAMVGSHIQKNRDAFFGISLGHAWWGNGFATEVVSWVVAHTFEQLGMHRISLGMWATNLAAKRVYEKCGFVVEGVKRKAFYADGEWVDAISMGILDEEYWARKKLQAA